MHTVYIHIAWCKHVWRANLFRFSKKIRTRKELAGCLGFNGPFRQYFSLYRTVSQREEKEEKL